MAAPLSLRSLRILSQVAFLCLGGVCLALLHDNLRLKQRIDGGMALSDMTLAPTFTLPSLDAERVSLDDYRGKQGTLLFFDATCDACESQAENWNALSESADRDGRFFIGVCRSNALAARTFRNRHHLRFKVAIDDAGVVSERYKVPGFPFTYVIDKMGRVGYERSSIELNCLRLGFKR